MGPLQAQAQALVRVPLPVVMLGQHLELAQLGPELKLGLAATHQVEGVWWKSEELWLFWWVWWFWIWIGRGHQDPVSF